MADNKKPFHVIIIGGGLGGLALAQGLKKHGISCAVYEKDLSRADRLQGYRIVPIDYYEANESFSETLVPMDSRNVSRMTYIHLSKRRQGDLGRVCL